MLQPLNYMTDPSAPYLHLEVARARRAVLQAHMRLAASTVLEHVSRTRLNRLKVQHFRKAIEAANATVGQWCDSIRHSGQPLHSPHIISRRYRRRRTRNRGTSESEYLRLSRTPINYEKTRSSFGAP